MFNQTEELIDDISKGRMVILLDDKSRENEGDLVFAAKYADREKINFLLKYARGLICVPLLSARAKALGLVDMTETNTDANNTAFTVSVDAAKNITTGISASDRAETIRILASEKATRSDFLVPGHIFPLKAQSGGVLKRPGHTEATTDLLSLAGIEPAVGVICEIMKKDGEMARKDDLLKFAKAHNIKLGTIEGLIKYKCKKQKKLKFEAGVSVPIRKMGIWELRVFRNLETHKENIVLIKGEIQENDPVLTRVHSECFTGDVLKSERCDCHYQLRKSMEMINKSGKGIIIYLRQEGRGIGLSNKIRAYQLQDNGYDTLDANLELGFQPDLREYSEAAEILKELNVSNISLITNNPEKVDSLRKNDINVEKQIILPSVIDKKNKKYLETKKIRFGHKIVWS